MWLNVGKDGVFFVNCMKPLGKVFYHLKGKGVPPTVVAPILAVVAAGCVVAYCYRTYQNNYPSG